jgi:peroxiredoxin (alkyl hydroperoxide reductase subunit C)
MSDAPRDLLQVDWSRLPAPLDDGAARHLPGRAIPEVTLPATDGSAVSLGSLAGRTVVYAYPLTGRPGAPLPEGWDEIPGARGCTPQNCAFRDHHAELLAAGAGHVFGLSTQDSSYQREAAERLHLPFPLLSDVALRLTTALKLPVMLVGGATLLKRMALIIDDGVITHVFYPVFPPDRSAPEVLAWLRAQSA